MILYCITAHALKITAAVLRARISRCPRQSNTAIPFEDLAALTYLEAEQEFKNEVFGWR